MVATGTHSPTAPEMDSFRSSSASSTLLSCGSEGSSDDRDPPPVSEIEEIPSARWLPASFRSKSIPPAGERDGKTRFGPAVHTSAYVAAGARSLFGMRRNNQVVSMEDAKAQDLHELDLFQTHVADRLRTLTSDEPDGEAEQDLKRQHRPLVTLSFLQRLLDAFLCIEEEFQSLLPTLLGRGTGIVPGSPVDRLVSDLLDRSVRSLDVCNVVVRAIDSLHFCRKYAEIAASSLCPPSAAPHVSEARFHRARKALSNLLGFLTPDQYPHPRATKEMPWLFGRGSGGNDPAASRYGRRSLSLSVSHNWSAAKQVQAMWANSAPPRGADATAAAVAVYTMSSVTVFAMWTLVVAFPCQEQGGHGGTSGAAAVASRFPAPSWQVPWAAPMVALQERIAEEWRRGRRGSPAPGLLAELQSLVWCGRAVVELGGGAPAFPLEGREREVVAVAGGELAAASRGMEEGLGHLRRRVREVFRRVVAGRAEILRCLGSPFPDVGKTAA